MRVLIALLVAVMTAAPAAAKSYSAERFDARIRILDGGALEITETVTFRFEDGTFTFVYREIPVRRSDGIEIIGAEMDGTPVPLGTGPGQLEVRRRSPLHVRWHFTPRSGSSHTFVLRYILRGVIKREAGGDVLELVAVPTQHAYRIDSSDVTIDAPASPAATPTVESRRVRETSVEPAGRRVHVLARGIRKDGWIKTRLRFAEGTVIAAAPRWQQRQIAADALAPRWGLAAFAVLAVGVVFLFGLRQRYDRPPHDGGLTASSDTPPDALRPAVAGAVASNGSVSLQHAMATMFALADRGAITITEEPKRWGTRNFTLHRGRAAAATHAEEAALINLAFHKKGQQLESAPLSQARNQIASKFRDFKKVVQNELRGLGLLDPDRMLVRSRYLWFSVATLILALVLVIPAAVLTEQYRGWPFLIPAAAGLVSLVSCVFYGALTPLSNEGVRRAERWRAYQRFLKEVARERVHLAAETPARLLPFAVALGLAGVWSKYVKHHPTSVPPWFRALTTAGDDTAFATFVAIGGAGHGGGAAGAGAGGAAGGGGSGAG
jgi:hypothetical protein